MVLISSGTFPGIHPEIAVEVPLVIFPSLPPERALIAVPLEVPPGVRSGIFAADLLGTFVRVPSHILTGVLPGITVEV